MWVTAEFTHEILPPWGIAIDSLQTRLDPVGVDVRGVAVSVRPFIEELSYPEPILDELGEEIGERQVPYQALRFLKAVLSLDVPYVDSASFDCAPFESRAIDALRITLRQIRFVTGIVDLDVHVGALQSEYRDEDANLLPWWATHTINLEGVGYLTAETWQHITTQISGGETTSIDFELLTEARRFYRQRNYNMAVANAVVACEITLYELVTAALLKQGGISKSSAERLAEQVNNRDLPAILGCFYELTSDEIKAVQESFAARNNILHGKQRQPAQAGEAKRAIDAARALRSARPR